MPETTVAESLKRAFNPVVGSGPVDKSMPYAVSLLVTAWVALVAAGVLPNTRWVDIINVIVGVVSGFYVRHAGRSV